MPDDRGRRRGDRLHAAAWPDMFANLQSAYAELTRAQFELERRAAEINQTRDLFERVVASMSEGLFLLDRLGHIQQANRMAATLTRRAEADLIGLRFADLFRQAVPATPWDLMRRAADGIVRELELELRTPGTAVVPVNVSCSLVRDDRGKISGVLAVARDVTDSRRAADALRLMAEASRVLGSSLDLDTTLGELVRVAVPFLADWCAIELVEGGALRLVAAAHVDRPSEPLIRELYARSSPSDDWLGHPSVLKTGENRMLADIPPSSLADAGDSAELLRALGLSSHLAVAIRIQGATGGVMTLNFGHSNRHYDAAAIALAQDLAGRVVLAVENARMYQSAHEANRLKDEFLATLSHELRTPLGAILGWSRMLRTGELRPPARAKALDSIERNAQIQMQLVNDILDIARSLTGKIRVDLREIDFVKVVCDAVEAVTPAVNAKQIRLDTQLPETVPIMGDDQRLQQVVWNLISNAVKFTPAQGCVTVRVSTAGDIVELSVADSGIGIRPEFLPHVFDKFRQADGSVTRRHGGLGLGLAIVRQLVELHGGHVEAHSDGEGRGATFTVQLPIRQGTAGESSATSEKAADHRQRLRGVSILIVDDDPDARELARLWLEEQGARVRATASAAAAMVALAGAVPDVLMLDLAMPDVDGYELLRRMRAPDSPARHAVALAYSAHAQDGDRQRALAAGFDAHLAKPADEETVVNAVENLVNRRKNSL